MEPINSNTSIKPKQGCTPVSSACVIWQGPDIPCIDLCKGDSVDQVVYKLAQLLCEITDGNIDITSLDFKCLVQEGQSNPETLIATVQALIDKTCYIAENCCNEGGGGSINPTPIPLPACLYYEEDGDLITQLLPADYSHYLAVKICMILTAIESLQTGLVAINTRVTNLENILNNVGIGSGGGEITVQTQCASGSEAGQTVTIQQAFANFENKFCQLQSLLGSNTAISTAIAKECANLDSSTQLSDAENIMSSLAGWTTNPTTLSQTIVNMWLTICDIRTSLYNVINAPEAPCALIPPFNVRITDLTTETCTIRWNLPPTGSYSLASAFNITITEWDGTAPVGAPIASTVVSNYDTSHTFTSIGTGNKVYIAQVMAIYPCGDTEPAYAIGKIVLSPVRYLVKVSDSVKSNSTITEISCHDQSYPVVERITTVTLVDIATGLAAINPSATINVVLQYGKVGDCTTTPYDLITIPILPGQSSGSYTYFGEGPKDCGQGSCAQEYKAFNSGYSISNPIASFDPSVPD